MACGDVQFFCGAGNQICGLMRAKKADMILVMLLCLNGTWHQTKKTNSNMKGCQNSRDTPVVL